VFRLDLDAKMDMGVRTLCIGVGSVKLFEKINQVRNSLFLTYVPKNYKVGYSMIKV
jgi:hypothetical protein